MPRLSIIAREELDQRGWSLEMFGKRAEISTSLAHQIANEGRDNVRTKTFEGIARAFGMTPTQLRQRIDGTLEPAPLSEQRARIARLLYDVPDERLDCLEQHVTLAVQPVPTTKRRGGGSTKSLEERRLEIRNGVETGEPDERKRRQFAIRRVSNHPQHAVDSVLAALGLNRDSRPLAVGV